MAHLIDLRKKPKEAVKKIETVRKIGYPPLRRDSKRLSRPVISSESGVRVSNSVLRAVDNEHRLARPVISWEAPSFYYNPQKKYLSMIIMGLVAAGGGLWIFQKDSLSAIFLMMTSLMFILYANKKPTVSQIIVNDTGVSVADTHYPYRDLKSFWIDYNPGGNKELSLESKKWYLPYVKVSIAQKDPIEIRSLMLSFIPEKQHEASIADLIARKIGL
ncbi:MAG: hypothetical protein A3B99_03105 [Candidatus Yanofskybacteria bacterium RIFCSPHIGHO2_02_FULL_44_12b]|nr:MAG: hypothetical protein A2659_02880 [Candidatus Yanofskybacteria bacterium RIFCSPHIGHO2_01_FULL_44_24]OGN15061.1 MAG: hypothetical protein A3B99_03105 [Candidatus Yanofskybacteria bacterium RIFCSPHIGHO2_02_FULL_44_12b]OGN26530.1 MAG: hypothetical protein A2925_03250 [Candidatus Yanofskybacteria bacterium RIFCSPLOWO2_01_FULL_44_22]